MYFTKNLMVFLLVLIMANCDNTNNATSTSSISTADTALYILANSFAGITLGDTIAQHKEKIELGLLRTGEGDFEIYEIHDDANGVLGHFMPDGEEGLLVGDISVTSPVAQTKTGIKVGDSFGQLLAAYPKIVVHGSEIESRTYAVHENVRFRIDEAHTSYELAVEAVSKEAKIIEIVLTRP
jgi:hypothetical protein